MLTIDRYCARAALERQLLRSTPRTIRATIEGLPHIRVLREGHPRLVPIIEIPDDEIASMLPAGRPAAEMFVTTGAGLPSPAIDPPLSRYALAAE